MKKTLNPFENAKRIANGAGGVSPAIIEEIQGEITILGSQNTQQAQDITDIKAQLEELAGAYSTTEHKTGKKWIDGNDIYEKTVLLENVRITENQGVVVGENFGIAKTINAILRVESENGTASIGLWINGSNQIVFQSPASYAQGNVYVTIEYTKTGA